MLYGPWPRRGRLLRHFWFSSSFPRVPNPGGQGHVKGGPIACNGEGAGAQP
jgi:hypothetical protein